MNTNPQRDEILRRINPQQEFERHGGMVAKGAHVSSDGWLSVHSVNRPDIHASAAINVSTDPNKRGIYVDHAPTGDGALSFFDMIVRLPQSPWMMGKEAYQHYAKATGVDNGSGEAKPERPAPTLGDVEGFQKNLSPETMQFLRDKRGFTEETIAKYKLGWCLKRERNSIPVFDEKGNLVNIRFHNSKKEPKTLNWAGYGSARLWGLDRLAKAAPGTTILVTEGEADAMLVEQETGYITVSGTNGAKSFQAGWVKYFKGFHVVLLYDSDQAGREAVQNLVLPAFKAAIQAGEVLSIKIVWLYDKPDKSHKDFTDWIVKDGGSGPRLKELIQGAPPHNYPTPTSHLEDPISLPSFELIDRARYAGRRVTVPLQVFGENTVAYHAVEKFSVVSCPMKRDSKCTGRAGHPGVCMEEVVVPLGERVLIAGVRATDSQLLKHLRAYICDKDRSPSLTVQDEDRLTIREVYAHQVVGPMAAERIEIVEKPIYIIGGSLVEIGKYQGTGRVVTSYRDQQPTMLVDTLDLLEEDYQGFALDIARPHLQKLQAMDVDDIAMDLSYHVTRIYKRPWMHLGVLLVLCSPLWINFPGEGRIRGWLIAIMVGDTGTGKTAVSQKLFEFARVGDRVSGLTASRTGITYGIEHDERRGWRVKAGALLKQNHQALIIDEAQDLPKEELKTMAEGLDTGTIKIDRIQHKVFESATRTIFSSNPKPSKDSPDQKRMGDYIYGCQALKGLFPNMMLRRADLFLFAMSDDIENKEEIFNPPEDLKLPQVTAEDLRALIFFAWNLKEEQVIITPEVGQRIRRESLKLSQIFGADEPAIVYPEDFRKTMARLSVAYAVLDLSTNDDFSQIVVLPGHVSAAADFIQTIYEAENCRLDKFSEEQRKTHNLGDEGKIKSEFQKLVADHKKRYRFLFILRALLTDQNIRQNDLKDELGVSRMTVNRDCQVFIKHHLAKSGTRTGYFRTPKLVRFIHRLEKSDPDFYNLLLNAELGENPDGEN